MAKTKPAADAKTAKATATKAAETPAAESQQKQYTEQAYDELDYSDEVVVEVGPRVTIRKNKVQEVEPARNVVMTKAGYEAMPRDEEGDTTHIPSRLLGVPEYKTVKDRTVPGGSREDFDVLYFAEAKAQGEGTEETGTGEGGTDENPPA